MLYIHELHSVVGKEAKAFEAAYRDGWMPALAASGDARLLWYLDLAHGSGLSYRVVTITAVTDGRAWQRLVRAGGERRPPGLGAGTSTVCSTGRRPRCSLPCPGPISSRHARRRPGRGHRARSCPLHGGHHVALPRSPGRLHRGGRQGLRPGSGRRRRPDADARRRWRSARSPGRAGTPRSCCFRSSLACRAFCAS